MKTLFWVQVLVISLLCYLGVNTISAADWSVSTQSKEMVYAITENDTDNAFSQFCYRSSKSCVYLLGLQIACESGQLYPVLINSDIGSQVMMIRCFDQIRTGHYRYAFTDFDGMDAIVRKASKLGLAFPMEGDQFKVIRFSLNGADSAITRMKNNAFKFLPSKASVQSEEDL